MSELEKGKVIILGINGHIGHAAAEAFAAAGWQVTGFGRTNRRPIPGVRFIAGDANEPGVLASAIGDAEVVFNGLHLPYDKWFNGRAEAQLAGILDAVAGADRTLLFPGTIYNYAASDRRITPDMPQVPERPRGEIRVRMEAMIAEAVTRGDMRAIILRAGDFYGPGTTQDWFDQLILRDVSKGRVALAVHEKPHAWAYLPDLGRAFVWLAENRASLPAFARHHFAGHYEPASAMFAAIEAAAGRPLKRAPTPWLMLGALGLAMPVMREFVKMRYLWDNPMELVDPDLEAMLGPDFGTPFADAVAATAAPFLAEEARKAAA